MRFKSLLLIGAAILVTGCASSRMIDAPEQQLVSPSPDKAQIVFVRSSFVGSAIQAVIYDASGGGAQFVGILSNAKKLAYDVEPGKHTFMVVSEAADFMEAEVVGGKTYYAIVTPRMGAWRARFSMHPVRNGGPGEFQIDSDEFRSWMADSKLSQNTPESYAWATENEASVLEKQREYWAVWQEKTPQARAERTLNPDDGI
ncbi:MAG: hypothetical protein GTO71_02875 [Woeseiaceae bacterium]|nr:hypothetical protein [Woeseiaceae bacterium]NIP20055.1 hypothetical protein [Woeseiaceae bacterium]NIS88851.1 hypothetical protein [Woeseiaceae bacterium]